MTCDRLLHRFYDSPLSASIKLSLLLRLWNCLPINAGKKAQIQAHARALAALLYEETDPEQVEHWQVLK